MGEHKKTRAGGDRRGQDVGPPSGWRERRKAVERRLPEVLEVPFSEWLFHLRARAREPQEV